MNTERVAIYEILHYQLQRRVSVISSVKVVSYRLEVFHERASRAPYLHRQICKVRPISGRHQPLKIPIDEYGSAFPT